MLLPNVRQTTVCNKEKNKDIRTIRWIQCGTILNHEIVYGLMGFVLFSCHMRLADTLRTWWLWHCWVYPTLVVDAVGDLYICYWESLIP